MWFFFAIVSTICIVFKTILKKYTLKNINEIDFLIILYFFNSLFVLFSIHKVSLDVTPKESVVMFLIGFFSVLALYLSTKAMKYLELSYFQPLSTVMPLFVALLAYFFLNESLSLLSLLGIIIIVVACFIISIDLSGKNMTRSFKKIYDSKYSLLILIAMFLGALNTILDKFILKTISPLTLLFYSRFILLIGFILLGLLFFQTLTRIRTSFRKNWRPILFLSIINLGVAYFYNKSLAYPESSTGVVTAIRSASLIAIVIVGGKILKEKFVPKRILASVMIMIGIILIGIG